MTPGRSTPIKLADAIADPNPEPATPGVERLAWRLDDIVKALGVSRRTLERERSAGRFPPADLYIGKMPLWRPETIRR